VSHPKDAYLATSARRSKGTTLVHIPFYRRDCHRSPSDLHRLDPRATRPACRQAPRLILLLADSYLANSRPAEAIAILEPAFQEQSERDDLRARLAAAYSRAGRKPEAASLGAKQGSGSTIEAVNSSQIRAS